MVSINLAYQRGILSGIFQETYLEKEIREKENLLKEVYQNITLFTKEQQLLIKLFIREISLLRRDGCYDWLTTEVMEALIAKKFSWALEEYIEILATSPLVESVIPIYLKRLQKNRLGELI